MKIRGEAKLLRIFIGDSDKSDSIPLYEKIVTTAKKEGLAGATVFKAVMGFGGSSRIHTSKILRLSEDMPLVIEIVDENKKIDDFLNVLDNILEEANCGGLVTMEKAEVIRYSAQKK